MLGFVLVLALLYTGSHCLHQVFHATEPCGIFSFQFFPFLFLQSPLLLSPFLQTTFTQSVGCRSFTFGDQLALLLRLHSQSSPSHVTSESLMHTICYCQMAKPLLQNQHNCQNARVKVVVCLISMCMTNYVCQTVLLKQSDNGLCSTLHMLNHL